MLCENKAKVTEERILTGEQPASGKPELGVGSSNAGKLLFPISLLKEKLRICITVIKIKDKFCKETLRKPPSFEF